VQSHHSISSFRRVKGEAEASKWKVVIKDAGRISSVFQGIALVEGLAHTFLHEMLADAERNPAGIVIGFGEEGAEALFFSEALQVGDAVYGSGRFVSTPV
jgi:F0F1-type ATP synthase alpha subunit